MDKKIELLQVTVFTFYELCCSLINLRCQTGVKQVKMKRTGSYVASRCQQELTAKHTDSYVNLVMGTL
jgi:hypothetical protein